MAPPEQAIADLEAVAADLAATDEAAAGPIWGRAHKAMLKCKASPGDVASIVMRRDLDALNAMIRALRGEDVVVDHSEAETRMDAAIPAETLKKAMKAFRKRLKLTRLDHESRLSVSPLTGGKKADFDAIMAPHDFPDEVWLALVAQGQLKAMGKGFYTLPD